MERETKKSFSGGWWWYDRLLVLAPVAPDWLLRCSHHSATNSSVHHSCRPTSLIYCTCTACLHKLAPIALTVENRTQIMNFRPASTTLLHIYARSLIAVRVLQPHLHRLEARQYRCMSCQRLEISFAPLFERSLGIRSRTSRTTSLPYGISALHDLNLSLPEMPLAIVAYL